MSDLVYEYRSKKGMGVAIRRRSPGSYVADVSRIGSDGALVVWYNKVVFDFMNAERAGLTNEALLKILIDRIKALQATSPCEENTLAASHLEAALKALEDRDARRR